MKIIYFRSGQTFLHELLFTIFKGIVQFAHWLPNDMRKIYYGNQWGPSTVWLPTFFKISSFVFSGREKFIQVWKDLKEILTWFYYFFFVNNSSKDVTFLCCELCANIKQTNQASGKQTRSALQRKTRLANKQKAICKNNGKFERKCSGI